MPQDNWDGLDRRQLPPSSETWHLDKKVPLSLIFAMLVQAAMVIWAVADIKKDVEVLKSETADLRRADDRLSAEQKDDMKVIQGHYARLEAKLDRLIERSK